MTDSPVTPEPMVVEVLKCPCGAIDPKEFCCGIQNVGTIAARLLRTSLAAAYIALGRLAETHIGMFFGPGGKLPKGELAYNAAVAAVRHHPDFRPDQKEGTNDGK